MGSSQTVHIITTTLSMPDLTTTLATMPHLIHLHINPHHQVVHNQNLAVCIDYRSNHTCAGKRELGNQLYISENPACMHALAAMFHCGAYSNDAPSQSQSQIYHLGSCNSEILDVFSIFVVLCLKEARTLLSRKYEWVSLVYLSQFLGSLRPFFSHGARSSSLQDLLLQSLDSHLCLQHSADALLPCLL